jgi:hypothetical protein
VEGRTSPFRSSPPLVEEDASAFRSSPPRIEVDVSAPRYEEDVTAAPDPPRLEDLWEEMEVTVWEALPPVECAKREVAKKAEEEKHATRDAA